MKRPVRQISRLAPLQRDTAKVVPNSTIKGGNFETNNIVGTKLSDAITVTRIDDKLPVNDTNLRIIATAENRFTVSNVDTGYVTTEKDASVAAVEIIEFSGVKITIDNTKLTGVAANDICDVYIMGDSTYIVPGTILGRIKDTSSDYYGWYEPVGSKLDDYDVFRVCGGTVETNKADMVAPVMNVMNNDDKYTVDVYVFAQVIESVCRDLNLTDEIKAKMQGIVWE